VVSPSIPRPDNPGSVVPFVVFVVAGGLFLACLIDCRVVVEEEQVDDKKFRNLKLFAQSPVSKG
jgi:hypothetical protein